MWLVSAILHRTEHQIEHFHYHSKFYWTALTHSLSVQSERSNKMMNLHKSSLLTFSQYFIRSFAVPSFWIPYLLRPWPKNLWDNPFLPYLFSILWGNIAEVFCFIAYILLQVKFEAQKKILHRLESCLQMLNGVKVTTAAPKLEGLCCHLHPIIPSVSPRLPILYLLSPLHS